MSQYFKARRKRGACYGTLWKQHSSSIASIVTNSGGSSNVLSTMYDFDQQESATSTHSSTNIGGAVSGGSESKGNAYASNANESDKVTVVSGGSRKETNVRNDYLKMIHESQDDDNSQTNTSTPTSTSTADLKKKSLIPSSSSSNTNSAMLFASKRAAKQVLTAALEKNERAKNYEFCVLVGNTLTGYENLTAFRRGDHPIVSESIHKLAPCIRESELVARVIVRVRVRELGR